MRAASTIPKGAQVTTSYMDTKGGVPLADRRRALQVSYGFKCGCARCKVGARAARGARGGRRAGWRGFVASAGRGARSLPSVSAACTVHSQVARCNQLCVRARVCHDPAPCGLRSRPPTPQLEESLPEDLQRRLESLHALSADGGAFDGLAAAAGAKDAAKLAAILARVQPEVDALNAALTDAKLPAGSLDRSVAAAAASGFLLNAARARMAAAAAAAEAAGGGEGAPAAAVEPADLLDLVEVLRVYQPGGATVLGTAADALNYTAAKHGTGSKEARAALELFLKVRPRRPARCMHLQDGGMV